jgi:hypothetical protein
MNIVTGYTGTPHVTANEAQALNQGIFGPENYVLDVGEKFSATLVDANNITIEDGEGVMQGVQFRIAPGETENVSIDSGTTGYNRIDLICARYTKDAQTGVEAVNLVVIKGTPTASTPSAPAYNTGNVLLNDSPVDFPLYSVTLTGLAPTLTQLFANRIITASKDETIASQSYDTGVRVATQQFDVDIPAGNYIVKVVSDAISSATIIRKYVSCNNFGTGGSPDASMDIPNNSRIPAIGLASFTEDVTVKVAVSCYVQSSSAVDVRIETQFRAIRI